MRNDLRMVQDGCLTNEQAHDRALEVLLSVAGQARTKAILAEVVLEFRKRESGNAHFTGDRERDFAFGPDLLARARVLEQGVKIECPQR
ncbi:TPA: hypothetical protein QDA90_000118 [Burkholderia vietnamiensis]|nr:hypothetical protein [Burkholderia vietnamiensis]HDR8975230.1 hypothetical protein [Burkholderia vietnamiensis]HDR9064874.1 hypothetical protein [Burkholderia vietnamiensis]